MFNKKPLLFFAALFLCSTLNANSFDITLAVSSDEIRIGDSFEVEVLASFDPGEELFDFAFQVDPLGLITTKNSIVFEGWSLASGFLPFLSSSPSPLIDGQADFFSPVFGGSSVLLATLQFSALTFGSTELVIEGLASDFHGAAFVDVTNNLVVRDIVSQTRISVVPDTSSTGVLGMIATFFFIGIRSLVSS
ncbi:hypothetical protein QEH56_24445 [Pelagicoccus enzymogenes]|uniref:hypothetical protein n=1 Tax=Pelagicoccus enzymogenes TaxID=2773457 RepID=UPI00280FAA72|nr:hypothetical protein [Pelagicoccus enzymogenes]MDQ8201332.1 hypothetical protein [Pelagicoccus enzymogenes]